MISARGLMRQCALLLPPPVLKPIVRYLNRLAWFPLGEPELKLLHGLVDPNRQAVDIGAHRGLYSIVLEGIVGSDRLLAFEPLPHSFSALRRLFPSVQIFNVAISVEDGERLMTVPQIEARLRDSRATLETKFADRDQVGYQFSVRTRRLDSYFADGTLNDVGFIKIDVEGHELDVLKGGSELLARCRPVILVEVEQRHHRKPISEVFQSIRGMGYNIFYHSPPDETLAPLETQVGSRTQQAPASQELKGLSNFICLPKDTLGWAARALDRLPRNQLPVA